MVFVTHPGGLCGLLCDVATCVLMWGGVKVAAYVYSLFDAKHWLLSN